MYIGTPPQSGFISQEANQYFTGLTQNFIDLNQSISSLSSVIVLVNGVVQENSDLTLTSSTRITLGATLVSADKVTCIYVAKISSTQAPATGSVTSDMLSGSIANSKLATDPLNASNLASGTVPTARLGSGTASSSTVLYGDNTFKAEPSGAFVSLASSDSTSNVTNVVFDNVFSDTYSRYIIYIDTMFNTSAGEHLYFRFRKSNGSGGYEDEARTGYVYAVRHIRNGSTSDYNLGANSGGATTHGTLTGSIQNSTGEHGLKAIINVYRPSTRQSQATMTYLTCDGTYRSHANDDSMSVILSSTANNYHTDAMLGIKFYFSGGNVDDHKIRVYGVVT